MGDAKEIEIIDVGPRDGFQNVRTFIDTEQKLQIIDGLVRAGIRSMEVTSFVHPKAIPQMADAAQVAQTVRNRYPDLRAIALVPNLRGAENAAEAGIREISCVISASEAHNKANVNRTVAESLEGLQQICEAFPKLRVRLDIATAFGCPFSGNTEAEQVLKLAETAVLVGVKEIVLCDTIGVANPVQVAELARAALERLPGIPLTMHFHNTRGLGLANICSAIQAGVTSFETSVGGLGGCPFAPGSEGNTATEDTVHMLRAMGMDTGVDLDRLLETVQYVAEHVDAEVTGKMLRVTSSSCSTVSGKA